MFILLSAITRNRQKRLHHAQIKVMYSQFYMIKTNVAFLEGRLLSSQSEQFKMYSKSFDWLKKSRPSKKATFVLIM